MTELENTIAPEFELLNQSGEKRSSKDFSEKKLVLFFYPKDSTPGCTIEAKAFSSLKEEFLKKDTVVYGVSGGTVKGKAKFCEKSALDVELLNDEDFSLATAFKSYGKKKFMGREYLGISRHTFILSAANKKGERTILKSFTKVIPIGHAKEVLADL